jgi:peptide deformylase
VSILEVRRFPDPILSENAKQVREIDGRIAGMLNSMVDTMYVARGIGLAAPQIGVLECALVVDTDPDNRGRNLIKIINPVIVEASGEITYEEGCLSIVNFTAEVQRAQRVLVRGWSPDQKEIEIEAENLEAVCLQHEIDHLEGKLLTDHISKLKREMYRKRLKRGFKANEAPAGDGSPRI